MVHAAASTMEELAALDAASAISDTRSRLSTSHSVRGACLLLLALAGCGSPPPSPIDASSRDGGDGDDASVGDDGGDPTDAGVDSGVLLEEHDVLFVGNSYVFTNDVSGHYRAIAA